MKTIFSRAAKTAGIWNFTCILCNTHDSPDPLNAVDNGDIYSMYKQTACFILIWALSYCSELLITGNTWRRMTTWPHDFIHHYLLFLRLSFYLRIWTTWECSQSTRQVLQLYSDLNLQTQRTCLSLNIKNLCGSVWMLASPGTVDWTLGAGWGCTTVAHWGISVHRFNQLSPHTHKVLVDGNTEHQAMNHFLHTQHTYSNNTDLTPPVRHPASSFFGGAQKNHLGGGKHGPCYKVLMINI